MRHTCPNGDVGIVFERALMLLLQHLEETKLVSRPQRPRGTMSGSRRIPSAVRRAVWVRDNGQCAFIGTRGDARSAASSSFITWCRLRMAERPRSTTFSCAVAPTTNTSRTNCLTYRRRLSCVSAATFGVVELGPDRVAGRVTYPRAARSLSLHGSVVSSRLLRRNREGGPSVAMPDRQSETQSRRCSVIAGGIDAASILGSRRHFTTDLMRSVSVDLPVAFRGSRL